MCQKMYTHIYFLSIFPPRFRTDTSILLYTITILNIIIHFFESPFCFYECVIQCISMGFSSKSLKSVIDIFCDDSSGPLIQNQIAKLTKV
jgi:hypothetical protein